MSVMPICRLSNCRILDEGCAALVLAWSLNPSHLRELYLDGNRLGDLGVKHLSAWFKDPLCQLEKIGYLLFKSTILLVGPLLTVIYFHCIFACIVSAINTMSFCNFQAPEL